MTMSHQETLRALVHSSARFLDDRCYDDFTALFHSDGEYRIVANAPECPSPMTWMSLSRKEMVERFEAAPKHEWQIATVIEQTRLIAVDDIGIDEASANTSSTFCLYHTDEDGRSDCYAVGRYDDKWSMSGDGWKLNKRIVNLKTRMLAVPSPLPI